MGVVAMMDDIDRDCVSSIRKALLGNLPDGWSLAEERRGDPSTMLVLEHNTQGYVGQPTVTVQIKYGKPKDGD